MRVSQTSPGWRFPQGPDVSVPDFYKGQPTIPRRRQEVCACADRPAEAFFSFGPCTARFLFHKMEKKMGGASWMDKPPAGADTPEAAAAAARICPLKSPHHEYD